MLFLDTRINYGSKICKFEKKDTSLLESELIGFGRSLQVRESHNFFNFEDIKSSNYIYCNIAKKSISLNSYRPKYAPIDLIGVLLNYNYINLSPLFPHVVEKNLNNKDLTETISFYYTNNSKLLKVYSN